MNDSFGQISSPARALATRGFGGGGQTVQILQLPSDIAHQARTLRLEGQITNFNTNNNTARISTDAGEITARVRGTPAPQVGQNIEIEIPPARNNSNNTQNANASADQTRQAIIRGTPSVPNIPESARIQATYTSPPQGNPQVSSPAPRQTIPNSITSPVPEATTNQQTQQNYTGSPTRNTTIPPTIQENLLQTTSLSNAQNTTRVLLNEAIVRLLPTPPAQAQNIATQFAQSLPATTLNNITQSAFSTPATARTAPSNLTPSLPLTNANNLNLQLQNIAQPLQISTTLAPENSAQASITQTGLAGTIPASQTLPVQPVDAILQQNLAPNAQAPQATASPSSQTLGQTTSNNALNAILTPALPPTSVQGASANNSVLGPIDVKISQIFPPMPLIQPIDQSPIFSSTPQAQTVALIVPSTISTTPNLISNNNAISVTAQVTGFTPQGLPLVTVQWPGARIPQSFTLQSPAQNLQLGTQLQITPATNNPSTTAQVSSTLARNTMTNPLLLGFQWPAMDEVFTSLLQNSPALAASLGRTLPNAGTPQQLAPAAMAVIAAIRTGDIGAWLGERKLDLLQRMGKSDLLNALRQSTNTGAPAADAAPTSDWRAVPLPMFWEGEIHKITLYTRKEGGDQDNQNKNKGGQTRFIFDLSLSRIGDIQLDGLFRDKRLDLVVRTQNAFSLPMQQTMRQAYSHALDHTDLTGDLNFQGSTKSWVHVLEQKEELGVDA